ncbi:MAG: SHOCT domain-containing protein [Thalassobaculum sp.]|uniref:SHOCT domain-containing protein n=1 Tax=Thalassobaculum sp. TaxID=2022740 RepID=UPI0032ED23C5
MKQAWTLGAGLVAGVVGAVPRTGWAQSSPGIERYPYGQHMMWWGGEWYGMAFGHLFMIAVLAMGIALAVLLVRWLGGPWHATAPHQASSSRAPLDILKERFARGEIDKAEYEERRRVLDE